jgi:hypothetical protein
VISIPHYVLTGMKDPADWTEEVILERDSKGEPSKVLSAHSSVEMTEEEAQDLRKNLGVKLHEVKDEEADKLSAEPAPLRENQQRDPFKSASAPAVRK